MHLFTAAALTYAAPRAPPHTRAFTQDDYLGFAPHVALQVPTFTQDDYLGFTSRHSLVGNGTRLAWVEKVRGTEKVFAVDLASSTLPVVIANYTDAEGYSIGALTLDGESFWWTRATPSDTNPAADADPGTEVETLTIKCPTLQTCDGRVQLVAKHVLRAVQHGKATFATTEGGRIRISEYDGTPGDPLTTLVRTAGALAEGCTAANPPLAWSPDGNTLAFSVFRLDHSFIGLYTRGERRVRWLAPSMDSDRCPVWSPDGTRLAFVRFRAASIMTPSNGAGGGIAGWLHQAPTFSVMVADVAAPVARPHAARVPVAEAFREVADGSYPGTGENGYGSRPLVWTKDGLALVVGSEASGHVHLVSVLAAGDVALGTNVTTPLTPTSSASCEAQSWSYAADADALFVAQTCADVLGADALWIQRIPASAGGTVVNVTRADPNVAVGMPSMVALGGGGVAYLASTHNASTQVVAWRPSQPAPTPLTADAPPKAFSAFVRPRLVSFPSLDGKATIHAQLFEPAGGASTAAAAIFTHGGSQRQMYGAIHFSPTYANLYTACQQLVLDHGITVLSINYRSGVGYGRDFRLCGPPAPVAPGERRCGSLGALEYDDVKAGRAYIDGLFAKAPPKVGIFGLSYGGLNCLQALSRDPASYAAGVCNAPVFNWVSQLRYDGAKVFDPAPILPPFLHQLPVGPTSTDATPGWPAQSVQNAAVAYASSPASHMGNITGPLLLVHGDLDEEVPYQESLSLARALRSRLGPDKLETLFFPGECHGECAYANQLAAHEATAAFLARHLL